MKVLIGYDGSKAAHDILQDLEVAGLPEKGEMLVISVAEMWLPPVASIGGVDTDFATAYKEAAEQALVTAREIVAGLQARFPQWAITSEGDYGSPAFVILERAKDWKPDLIVLGAKGHSALERLVFGSVSHRIAVEAPCSVRIARPHKPTKGRPVHVMIGMDGSLGASDAVATVAARNWPQGCEAILVTSAGPFDLIGTASAEKHEYAHSLHEEAKHKLGEMGIFVTSVIKDEDPKHALIALAEKNEVDCLYLGTRNLKAVDRWLLGSVSTAVVSRAVCSVEVVRHQG
ncbi:MAG: universal stress protein [Blastocatellia bacterium]|nr:universal stress protein [Blastocatellia bacterium]